MLDERYSDIQQSLLNADYYTVPRERLPLIHYSKLSSPARHNIYIMRDFKDPLLKSAMEEDLSENQKYYSQNGYLILRGLIPGELVDAYLDLRHSLGMGLQQFRDATPFIEHKSIRDIACYGPLLDVIRELHGAELGLIFTLTGFKSTQRGWHQDSYLDPDDAIPRVACWISCGDVSHDCGPFEYIPKSHKWLALSNAKINSYLKTDYHWPAGHKARASGELGWGRIAEAFIDPSVYAKIKRDGCQVNEFTAQKGDVLFWYGRLMHRGSPPLRTGAERPGLIAHYAPLFERDRGYFARRQNGGHFIVPSHKIQLLQRD